MDPVNPSNNTARTSYRASDIFASFKGAYQCLKGLINKQYQNNQEALWQPEQQQPCLQPEGKETAGTVQASEQAKGPTEKFKEENAPFCNDSEEQELQTSDATVQQSNDPEAAGAREQQQLQPANGSAEQQVTGTADSAQHSSITQGVREHSNTQVVEGGPGNDAQPVPFSVTNFVDTFLTCDIKQQTAEVFSSGFGHPGFGAF